MKNTILTLTLILSALFGYAQKTEKQRLKDLSSQYKSFLFVNKPSQSTLKEMMKDVPENFKVTTEFIVQCITSKNKLLTPKYLTRPSDTVLKQIYLVHEIFSNTTKENPINSDTLIDSLLSAEIPVYELVDTYYQMMFVSVGNKNQPFNLSKTDLKLNDYGLKDETEKAILFLRCMQHCGTVIWGYLNIANPPNTAEALKHIKKYPKINGQPYYQFSDFDFTDFQMVIITKNGKESYKDYFLNKYYEVLLSHLVCLAKENAAEKEVTALLLGSILREEKYYKHTKHKETLEGIFKQTEKD